MTKFHDLMADALSEWRPVRNAADLAVEIAAHLDDDERERIFMRGLTDEVRKSLRRKTAAGVPAYSNVDRVDPTTGKTSKIYKQTELFSVDDFKIACDSYLARAAENRKVAVALAAACKAKHNVNPMPRRGERAA